MRTIIFISALVCSALAFANTQLIGQWQGQVDGEALVIQFNADGTGQLNQQAIYYQTQDNQLLIQSSEGISSYQWQLKGKQLIVQGGDLQSTLVLQRVNNNQNANKSKPKNTSAQTPQELVGKWCLVSSFSANAGGGSSSSRCFTLQANGRYQYQQESSMDAYGGGMWGGTSQQNQDSGRWSVNGQQITAQSDSGQVSQYQLQLKNHPKNNDPMICLDGECYVTYFQKAPW